MRKYQEVARTVFLASGDQKRKLHVDLQDKVTGLYTNILLFQKGLEKLPGVLRKWFIYQFVKDIKKIKYYR